MTVRLANDLFAGLVTGCIYGLFGAAICVLFRVSKIVNIAIGDIAMFGTMLTVWLTGPIRFPLWLAIVAVLLAVSAGAYVYDVGIVSRIVAKGSKGFVLVTFFFTLALAMFLEGLASTLFGQQVHSAPAIWTGGNFALGSLVIQRAQVVVIVATVVFAEAFALFLRHTLIGKALTACGQSDIGARVIGINPGRYRRLCLAASAAIAALFGILLSPLVGFTYSSGFPLGTTGLVAGAFAGLVHPFRAVAVGIAIGIMEALIGGYVTSNYQEVMVYAILAVVIIVRPRTLGTLGEFA